MAYSINQFICFSILITESVFVLSILHGKATDTPKILLIESNNNSDRNYTKNFNYTLTKDQKKHLRISCISNKPTRWRWVVEKDEERPLRKPINVTKEREPINETNLLEDKFVSNLTIHLGFNNRPWDNNFSCSNDNESKRGAHQFTTCVVITYFNDEPDTLHVFDGIPIKQCSAQLHNGLSIPNSSNCTKDLSVELTKLEAVCTGHRIENMTCDDLDSCDSYLLAYSSSACNGSNEMVNSSSNKDKANEKLSIQKQLFPQIVYCIRPLDSFNDWTSLIPLYPSVLENNWTNFSFYKTEDEARQKNSVQLYVLSPGQKDPHVNSLKRRDKFAEGETVNFVCVAAKYLFTKGFRWKINEEILPYYYELEKNSSIMADNSTKSLHIVQREITMSSKIHGNSSRVSCLAPIWNSEKFTVSSIRVSLYPPLHPNATINCEVMNETVNCSCQYSGWPQPTISWHVPVSLNMSITETLSSEVRIKNAHPHDKRWRAHKIFINPQRSSSKPTVVHCTVKNFMGIHNASLVLPDDSRIWYMLYIIIPIVVVSVCVMAVLVISCAYWRYRKKLILYAERQHNLTIEEINEFYSGASHTSTTYEALLLPYNSEYEIPKEQLIMDGSILGSGQFGLVLKGKIGPLPVAVKTIKPTADVIYFKSLLSELKILQFVGPHRNIVNLIGANTANIKKREVFLVLDFCSNGSLINFLRQCRERFIDFFGSENEHKEWPLYENSTDIVLTTNNLIDFALEIASALDHLASKNVIHGDLAARNVLVTEDLHAKICDFGLSKQLLHYTVYVQKIDCPLPLRWMALESLQDMEFSLASDKWSFGVVLWEIFSLGELPYPGEQWSFASYQMLQEGYRMAKPKYTNDSIYKLMLECWNGQPQQRPSYQYVISQLEKEGEMLT